MTTVLLHPSFILPSPFCFTSKSILNLSLYKKNILLWFYSTQSSENHAQILHQNKQKSKIESREIMQGSITQPTNSSILLVIEVMLCRQSILAKPPDRYLIKIPRFSYPKSTVVKTHTHKLCRKINPYPPWKRTRSPAHTNTQVKVGNYRAILPLSLKKQTLLTLEHLD